MVAVALLYRYADFVTLLGGTEFHLGWIVGVGMVGSLVMRLALGSCIDSYGTKLVWLGSTLLFAATCFAHLAIASHTGVAIYLLRISYCCAVAGIYGASMTFVSSRGPTERMAELVGMLGTAGFLGIGAGHAAGRLPVGLRDGRPPTRGGDVRRRRSCWACSPFRLPGWPRGHEVRPAACAAIVLVDSVAAASSRRRAGGGRGDGPGPGTAADFPADLRGRTGHPANRPVLHGLRRGGHRHARAHPPLARTLRHPADHPVGHGRHGGQPGAVPAVDAEWQLALPAVGFGCSHAILFPSVVAAGSITFPVRHRGLATLLVLAVVGRGPTGRAPRRREPCCATASRPACPPIRRCFSPWPAWWRWSAFGTPWPAGETRIGAARPDCSEGCGRSSEHALRCVGGPDSLAIGAA